MDYIKPIGDLTVGERVYLFVLSFFYGSVIAILVSFAISLFISIRNRISWMNSFLVLLLTLVILGFEILYFPFFKIISGTVGTAFHPLGMQYIIIINGSLMTLVGLFLFFNPWTKKIIRKQYDESHFAPKEKAELNYVGEKTDWTWD